MSSVGSHHPVRSEASQRVHNVAGPPCRKAFFGWGIAGTALLVLSFAGCGQLLYRLTSKSPVGYVPNPLDLPMTEDEFVWRQVVDSVDDYFEIQKEQPVQNRAGIVLEGRLDTTYQVGGTILEPWRKDSTAGFERLQSTFQSIRRRCTVFVRPSAKGYQVEIVVQKELEDTDRSQSAGEAVGVSRHDGTLLRSEERFNDNPITLGWIPLGRDTTLEQRILQDIFRRVTLSVQQP